MPSVAEEIRLKDGRYINLFYYADFGTKQWQWFLHATPTRVVDAGTADTRDEAVEAAKARA